MTECGIPDDSEADSLSLRPSVLTTSRLCGVLILCCLSSCKALSFFLLCGAQGCDKVSCSPVYSQHYDAKAGLELPILKVPWPQGQRVLLCLLIKHHWNVSWALHCSLLYLSTLN